MARFPPRTMPTLQPTSKTVFEGLVIPHRRLLEKQALRLTRNPVDAEDLVQQTLVRAFERFCTYRHNMDPSHSACAWLCAILRNEFFNRHRAQKREPHWPSLEEIDVPCSVRSTSIPERCCLYRAEVERIRGIIASLPGDYRQVATLAFLEEYSYSEIAERLNIPLGTVRSRLHRSRKLILRKMKTWLRE